MCGFEKCRGTRLSRKIEWVAIQFTQFLDLSIVREFNELMFSSRHVWHCCGPGRLWSMHRWEYCSQQITDWMKGKKFYV